MVEKPESVVIRLLAGAKGSLDHGTCVESLGKSALHTTIYHYYSFLLTQPTPPPPPQTWRV